MDEVIERLGLTHRSFFFIGCGDHKFTGQLVYDKQVFVLEEDPVGVDGLGHSKTIVKSGLYWNRPGSSVLPQQKFVQTSNA